MVNLVKIEDCVITADASTYKLSETKHFDTRTAATNGCT
jgi:hypothetical protein